VLTGFLAGYGDGGQHEQALWGWLAHIPGLAVVVPASPDDAGGLLLGALAERPGDELGAGAVGQADAHVERLGHVVFEHPQPRRKSATAPISVKRMRAAIPPAPTAGTGIGTGSRVMSSTPKSPAPRCLSTLASSRRTATPLVPSFAPGIGSSLRAASPSSSAQRLVSK